MKIKEDREFYKFCTLMPIKDMNKVSQLADEFETVDMEYPIAVSDRIYEFTIEEVREKLRQFFNIMEITDEMWKAFLECTFIGDGDCPECGGYMEWCENDYDEEFEGRDIFGDEITSKQYYSVYKCPDCGHKERK